MSLLGIIVGARVHRRLRILSCGGAHSRWINHGTVHEFQRGPGDRDGTPAHVLEALKGVFRGRAWTVSTMAGGFATDDASRRLVAAFFAVRRRGCSHGWVCGVCCVLLLLLLLRGSGSCVMRARVHRACRVHIRAAPRGTPPFTRGWTP